jgi:two-component system alkaline phosphatase synthesis response regulator PhoP
VNTGEPLGQRTGTTHRVLVADDEPHIGRIVKAKLEQGPFAVTLVYDGGAVFDALDAAPDTSLIVLDLMMPVLSGVEVLRRLRSDARWASLPCLVLSAVGLEEQHAEAMALGATDFMTKPFSPRRLLARASELVGNANPEAA